MYMFYKYFDTSRGKPLFGRKKIQKLVLLIDYLDLRTGKITGKQKLFNYKFVIWYYGPFSEELYQDLEVIVDRELVIENISSEVSYPRVRVDREEINLSMYNDNGFSKVIYVYKLIKENPKFITKILNTLRKTISEEDRGYVLKLNKIDKIVEMYWSYTPNEIERLVNDMLDIKKVSELLKTI